MLGGEYERSANTSWARSHIFCAQLVFEDSPVTVGVLLGAAKGHSQLVSPRTPPIVSRINSRSGREFQKSSLAKAKDFFYLKFCLVIRLFL